MPYIGIFRDDGREVDAPGYHRLDLSRYRFKLSPPDKGGHFMVINVDPIVWEMTTHAWDVVKSAALFDEVDDREPFHFLGSRFDPVEVGVARQVEFGPGKLCFDMTMYEMEKV